MSKNVAYILAVVLFAMAACGIGGGGFIYLGSLDPQMGDTAWQPLAVGLILIGVLLVAGGVVLVVTAMRKQKAEQAAQQNVTLQVDLPGQTKIEQMKCQSCGGALTSKNIKLVDGAPMVNCPYCDTVYQLTEEPKW
ncbi:MAG: hypothetical protein JXA13_15620 [Anaerolineales bacterium]|nr:hypothetical protein [Anaerolineales bacterium]